MLPEAKIVVLHPSPLHMSLTHIIPLLLLTVRFAVQVLNTDAEGRLTLADALVYAETKCGAEAIIDVATLTGACMVALGTSMCGMFSPNQQLISQLKKAGSQSGMGPLHSLHVRMSVGLRTCLGSCHKLVAVIKVCVGTLWQASTETSGIQPTTCLVSTLLVLRGCALLLIQ